MTSEDRRSLLMIVLAAGALLLTIFAMFRVA
jgi:hypothetical protein